MDAEVITQSFGKYEKSWKAFGWKLSKVKARTSSRKLSVTQLPHDPHSIGLNKLLFFDTFVSTNKRRSKGFPSIRLILLEWHQNARCWALNDSVNTMKRLCVFSRDEKPFLMLPRKKENLSEEARCRTAMENVSQSLQFFLLIALHNCTFGWLVGESVVVTSLDFRRKVYAAIDLQLS